MTKPRFFKPHNPLARMIQAPGGKEVAKALDDASANLDSIRDSTLAAVDADLAAIERLLGGNRPRPEEADLQKAYRQCNAIAGIAGSCGLAAVGQAAFSLCDLLDRQVQTGGWNVEAVTVHLDGMKLLRGGIGDAAERTVLDGLRKVTDKQRKA